MTNSFPIPSPPQELRDKWLDKAPNTSVYDYLIDSAARWGADQELEACCAWLVKLQSLHYINALRTSRRPKPLTLKERALETFDKLEHLFDGYGHDGETIREALEALPSD